MNFEPEMCKEKHSRITANIKIHDHFECDGGWLETFTPLTNVHFSQSHLILSFVLIYNFCFSLINVNISGATWTRHFCAKEMKGKLSFVVAKFGREFATKFLWSAREFSLSQTTFYCLLGKFSHSQKRNLVSPKFRQNENSRLRNFAKQNFASNRSKDGRNIRGLNWTQF